MLVPRSGLLRLYGPEIENAARLAENEVNGAGGVLGRPIRVQFEDDGTSAQSTVDAARALVVDQSCVALVGGLFSIAKRALHAQVASPLRIPYLSYTNYEGSIHGRYFFHFGALPQQHVDPMIRSVVTRFGPKIFFAGHDSEWARGSIESALRMLSDLSGEAIAEEYLPFGTTDFSGVIDRLARSGADAFVLFMRGPDFFPLLDEFCGRALEGRLPLVLGQFDEAMLQALSPDLRYEYYTCNTYFATLDNDSNRRFLEALRGPEAMGARGTSLPITGYGAGAYLCVHALADAIARAESTDADRLVAALETTRLRAPQGAVEMEPATHHARVNTYFARSMANGAFDILECYAGGEPTIPHQYRDSQFPMHASSGAIPLSLREQTPAHGMRRALDATTRWPEGVLDAIDAALIVAGSGGAIVAVNARAVQLFGHSREEFLQMDVGELMPPRFRVGHKQMVLRFEARRVARPAMNGAGISVFGYRRDGTEFPAEATVQTLEEGDRKYFVVTLRDATEQRRAEEALAWRAAHDPLTELPNRRLIEDRLGRALGRSRRSGQHVALLLVDLDNFKLVNDSFGHAMGDELMKVVGERLLSAVRPGDTVGRFGGDEFLVICEQLAHPDAVAPIAARVMQVIKRPCKLQGQRLYVSASIGVTTCDGDREPADMLREADAALYAAKERGRDGWFVFNERLRRESTRRLELASGLRTALSSGQLLLYAQPILSASKRTIEGAELLLRWRHPTEGFIPPWEVIPVAESTGLIVQVGRWVLEQALAAAARWRSILGPTRPFKTSVNVSARQLSISTFAADLERLTQRLGVDPKDVVLEMTESALFPDVDVNAETLLRLGEFGVSLAVDDFGTGYSSLSYLKKLPVHSLKIDKLFVDDLATDRESRSIVSAVIEMAHLLNLKVTAEGVETPEQLNVLRQLGCDSVQGYLFFRPMPLDAIDGLLRWVVRPKTPAKPRRTAPRALLRTSR